MEIQKELIPQRTYNTIISNIPIVCVDVVIDWNDSVLLVKRKLEPCKNMWFIPGGRLLKGELLEQAAIRKAKEETGIDCTISRLINVESTMFEVGANGKNIHTVNICYRVYPVHSKFEVKLDKTSESYKWIKTIDNDLHPYVRHCLKKSGL